jgi:hypothetical protein
MKLFFLVLFLGFGVAASTQPRPFCFSKEKLGGLPVFAYKDTISLYVATKYLSAYKGFDVFAPRTFSAMGRSWSVVRFSPAALAPKQVETLATWGKVAADNYFHTPYFVLQGEGAPAGLLTAEKAATAPKQINEYQKKQLAQYNADLEKLIKDSTARQAEYDGLQKDCDLQKKGYRATFDELSEKILAGSKKTDKWKALLANEILIAEESQIFLADTKNTAAGIKVADYTALRIKLLADLPKEEAALLPKYEQARAAIFASMEVCASAAKAKTALAEVAEKMATVRKKIADL